MRSKNMNLIKTKQLSVKPDLWVSRYDQLFISSNKPLHNAGMQAKKEECQFDFSSDTDRFKTQLWKLLIRMLPESFA